MRYLELLCVQFIGFFGLLCLSVVSPTSQAASVSDLLITEVMANPSSVTDSNGEWLELFNPTTESIDLNGIRLADINDAGHTISTSGSLLIDPGVYFVLARNGDSAVNGGVTVGYEYGSAFTLSNSSDQIIFSDSSGELLRLDYASGFAQAGVSMELIDAIMLPDNYAASSTQFGGGDWGTPGAAGSFTHTMASPVPLPGAAWLMASGLVGLVGFNRQRKLRF